jgi:X-X-X-Leu-X-X-Gly heptad repeat protein
MNKTLLLIICDFLLLNLLALTRWEKAEPPRATQAPVPELAANAVTKEQDLVEAMRQSLTDERTTRDQLAEKLSASDAALAAREQSLTAAQAEKNKLAAEKITLTTTLTEAQRTAADLGRKVAAAAQEATMTKEQLAQLQRELAEKQAEAERQRQALAARQNELEDANRKVNGLYTMVALSEQENKNLKETADTLKTQVATERQERAKVQETATQLAQGVGQLAEKSGELTKEIRDNRPINANVLFNDFLANRVSTTFTAVRKGFLGPVTRTKEASTVLVTDGRQVYALLHVADTVFSFGETGANWEKFTVEFFRPPAYHSVAGELRFLAHDPRIAVLPIDASQAAALGAKVYPLAAEPFKFPEAVLISAGGKGYGEVGFKLDASEPRFVRVDNRLFKRIFGDFAPSRGDLVFSKTGELLGIMVNSDYCALLKDFSAMKSIRTGDDTLAQQTGPLLDSLGARVLALPLKLQ